MPEHPKQKTEPAKVTVTKNPTKLPDIVKTEAPGQFPEYHEKPAAPETPAKG